MCLLRELFAAAPVLSVHGSLDIPIARIVSDSREVERGDLFVCVPGYRTEGGETRADRHDFIPAALQRGAAALVVERDVEPIRGVTVVRVADCWSTVAALADRYFGNPSGKLTVIGITGTSGKTSTTYFVDSVLQTAGHRVARIGTVEYRLGDRVLPAAQTTPEAPVLQSLLQQALEAGCTAAVIEVSSHALELRRVQGIDFDVAVFTNLSHDHLNFHPDMHHYAHTKGRLFEELSSGGKAGTAIINVDDPASGHMIRVNRGALLTYGVQHAADVRAREVVASLRGVTFGIETAAADSTVTLRHFGSYSVYNALAAAAVARSLRIDMDTIVTGLAVTPPVPGRFELVDVGQDFVVAVDYAHKPDALVRLLGSVRRLHPRRLITVFGCGGDRDRNKRPIMGRIAAELSDYVIVTSDNPRSEDPRAIIDEILAGTRQVDPARTQHTAEVDRAAAIRQAVDMAQPDDMVIIAGKGHETCQLVAGRRLEFDDRQHAREALLARLAPRRP